MKKQPLILTIAMPIDATEYFTALRDTYFPKYCNFLQAHLTFFHALPSSSLDIQRILEKATQQKTLTLEILGLKNMGNGVAFEVKCVELQELHKTLQAAFAAWLIQQDKKKLWPHITIQNKVSAYKAAKTFELLQKDFTPFSVQGIGIESWLYCNGPWEKRNTYLFEGESL